MRHPLTDELIDEIVQFNLAYGESDLTDEQILNRGNDMRSAADWQLKQVIEYIVANDWFAEPGRRIAELRKAMRPQGDNQ